MKGEVNNSLVLITNDGNQSFGTGFVIYKERNYSYILTCSHVVENSSDSLQVDSIDAKIIYQGSSDGLDLAIIKAQIDKEPLSLMESSCDEFEISGFKSFRNNDHILEPINCTLDTKIEFRPQSGEIVNGWKLNIDESDIIVGGYSGSPLICKESGKVVAVVSNRFGGNEGFAISIENLKNIWKDMPRNLVRKEGYVPKIFISTAHREPDISIAVDFSKELKKLGYRVFLAKTDIEFGKDWFENIQSELEACDYFLILLSKNSLGSEMVLEEMKKIKELQNGSNFPAILPVRVNLPFDYHINSDIFRHINEVQQLEWENNSDTRKIVEKTTMVISKGEVLANVKLSKVELPTPKVSSLLAPPTGPVPFDSPYYIERKNDAKCYRTLFEEKYSLVTLQAPRQYGKTSLMLRLIKKAKEKGYNVVSFNFQEFDNSLLSNLEDLLEFIYEMILFELDIEVNINSRIINHLTPMPKATEYIQKILKNLDKPLVLAIDDADRLFKYREVSREFFGLMRAWYEKAKIDPLWENLKMIFAYSTEAYLVIKDQHQSPFNLTNMRIEAFSKEELKEVLTRYDLSFDDKELEKLKSFVGGHPYLSRKIIHTIVSENQSFDEIIKNAHNENSIFSDHMRRYLWVLKENKKLLDSFHSILKGNSCNDDETCYVLEATGLIKDSINRPVFACELYQEFFYRKL